MPMPWCRCLDALMIPWCRCLDAKCLDSDALMAIYGCKCLDDDALMTYLDAYILMPMPWFQCLGFDTLILMPLWGRYVMNLCWWPELVCMIICKTIIRFDFFPQKVSSWKVSVPEKKKKIEALSLQPPFPVIPHYTLSNKHLAKKYPRLHVFFRGSLLCEWTQKSWTTPVKVYQWINDYFIQFLGHYRLE